MSQGTGRKIITVMQQGKRLPKLIQLEGPNLFRAMANVVIHSDIAVMDENNEVTINPEKDIPVVIEAVQKEHRTKLSEAILNADWPNGEGGFVKGRHAVAAVDAFSEALFDERIDSEGNFV